MKKILMTLAFCVFAYMYSIYFTGVQAESIPLKIQEIKNVTAGNCTEKNFCAIPREMKAHIPIPNLPRAIPESISPVVIE